MKRNDRMREISSGRLCGMLRNERTEIVVSYSPAALNKLNSGPVASATVEIIFVVVVVIGWPLLNNNNK